MKRILLSIITITAFGFGANAQNVNIPDANFKAYLVGNSAINTNADTEIQVSEASAFSGTINCSSLNISDLTGIEAFTVLTQLKCNYNSLSTLDVNQNTALTQLQCQQNSISTLDVSSNSTLTLLICLQNSLTALNVANGNNTNFLSFSATQNPNLTCVQVDNVAWSTTNWVNIDAGASFSTNCSVGINEQANDINLSIYPNPVSNQFTIEVKEQIETITIINVMGKTVKTIVPNGNTIDVSDLTKGIYFLQIQTDKGLVSKKFIKE